MRRSLMAKTDKPDHGEPLAADAGLSRYARQIIYPRIGEEGQRKLLASRITLIGCGALGSVLADTMVRAGVGFTRIVDRDYVELNNLQRQMLFNERHAAGGIPKAIAAAESLVEINSSVEIEPIVADANATNIEALIDGSDLILDGADNFQIRYLVNDAAVKHGTPWVYGACVGADGTTMPIVPGQTPCFRCIWETPPQPGVSPTCDTAGILAGIVHVVASLQAVEAIKILTGQWDALNRNLTQIDIWSGRLQRIDMQAAREGTDCICCKQRRFDFLAGGLGDQAVSLCGRDAVQIAAPPDSRVDFERIAERIAGVAKSTPTINRYLLRFDVDSFRVTLFRDGRAIIKGATRPEEARTIYARYIGT